MNIKPNQSQRPPRVIGWSRWFLSAGSFAALLAAGARADGEDPRINSWFTAYSGQYGRIYASTNAQAAGTAVDTWSNGSQTQSLPAYAGVQEVLSSADWVYLRTTGFGIHTMGPWPANFPNLPKNQKVLYRIPRIPAVPSSKTLTGLGPIGYFVDGVAMFDSRDALAWNGTTETQGAGSWNRDAYVNEGATFDPAQAHQENTGTYHYHSNPIALRYLLGDHVDFDSARKTYAESTAPVTEHSPILGWVRDGFPLYGPFGYASASNSAGGLRRMISGYQLRNGQRNTDAVATTGRASIPQWAQRFYGVAGNAVLGPNVSSAYPLGRYMEDHAYLGDLGFVQGVDFDLDEYNGRWCVTPEFPNGTYAYFVALNADGSPAFPYNIGRAFFGSPNGGAVTGVNENVTTHFTGGPEAPGRVSSSAAGGALGGAMTLVWSAVEGGTYRVETSSRLTAPPSWTVLSSNLVATNVSGQISTNVQGAMEFFRVARTALAAYDPVTNSATGTTGTPGIGSGGILSVSPTSAARGSSFTLTIHLDPAAQPPPPPQMAPINSVTLGTIIGTGSSHVSGTEVTTQISIPLNAQAGAQTVSLVFPGPPGSQANIVTYTLADGFTIN